MAGGKSADQGETWIGVGVPDLGSDWHNAVGEGTARSCFDSKS